MFRNAMIALAALVVLPASAQAQGLPADDHAAIKVLVENGYHWGTARVSQWVISSADCQTFMHQRSRWPNSDSIVNVEIRWDRAPPVTVNGTQEIRVKAENLYGDYLTVYTDSNASAVELAKRMNNVRARCAGFAQAPRPWPINRDSPAVDIRQLFNFYRSADGGFRACSFAAEPNIRLSGNPGNMRIHAGPTSLETYKAAASIELSPQAARGAMDPGANVDIGAYGERSELPSDKFRATATFNGQPVTIPLLGEITLSIGYEPVGWSADPAAKDKPALAQLLSRGGRLIVKTVNANGTPHGTFTFDMPANPAAYANAVNWSCD